MARTAATMHSHAMLTRWSLRLPLNLMAMVSVLLGMIVPGSSPAQVKDATIEADLERGARQIAIDEVALVHSWYRWPPGQFPLRVAVLAGDSLRASNCPDQWKREFDEYLRFINAEEELLVPTTAPDATLSAFAFFGPVDELEASDAYRFELRFASKPGIERQFTWQSQFDHSYHESYGAGDFIKFGAQFQEVKMEALAIQQKCTGFHVGHYLGRALLQGDSMTIDGRVRLRYGLEADLAIAWRVHRRLLSAMKKLPAADLDWGQIRAALLDILSRP
jgi:hypothetical protein